MPAPPLSNTFDGGVSGNTIATTDTGSGNAWSTVTQNTGATIKYSNAHAQTPALSGEFVTGTTAGNTYLDWTGLGSITTDLWCRCYMYITALPNGANGSYTMAVRNNAGTASAYIGLSTAGNVQARDAGNSAQITGTSVVPLNEWFRLECRVISSTTVGLVEWKLFSTVSPGDGPNGSTPTETHVSAATLVLAANSDQIRWGHGSSNDTVVSQTQNIDECAVSTTGWIGAASSPSVRRMFNPIPFQAQGRNL